MHVASSRPSTALPVTRSDWTTTSSDPPSTEGPVDNRSSKRWGGPVTGPLHDDELPVDEPLVRSLLSTSFPEYDVLPLRRLDASGSSNALFRLGDDLLVRL